MGVTCGACRRVHALHAGAAAAVAAAAAAAGGAVAGDGIDRWRCCLSCLLQVAFEGVGSMPMDRINSYRARKQREVDREMAARETRVGGGRLGAVLRRAAPQLLHIFLGLGRCENRT